MEAEHCMGQGELLAPAPCLWVQSCSKSMTQGLLGVPGWRLAEVRLGFSEIVLLVTTWDGEGTGKVVILALLQQMTLGTESAHGSGTACVILKKFCWSHGKDHLRLRELVQKWAVLLILRVWNRRSKKSCTAVSGGAFCQCFITGRWRSIVVVCYVFDHTEAVEWIFTVIKLGGISVHVCLFAVVSGLMVCLKLLFLLLTSVRLFSRVKRWIHSSLQCRHWPINHSCN